MDRIAKFSHFLPVRTSYSAEDYAMFYLMEIVNLHGALVSIILDHGTLFLSHFWKSLQKGFGTKLYLITVFHPQLNGQKRTIQTLKDMQYACVINYGGS